MVEAKKSRSYRDLEVWQLAIIFVKDIYQATEKFPAHENYGLTHQIRKAAISIPSNIAEGQFRNSSKEFQQFLSIGLGSAAEIETQLIIVKDIGYLSSEQQESLLNTLERIIKMLKKLRLSLK
jgi:four helix bundle protein